MSCYLSTSCFGRIPVGEAVEICREISPNYIELSAPHDYQPTKELEILLYNLKNEGLNLSLHNYFPPPQKSFVLNMAAEEDEAQQASKDLVLKALNLAQIAGSPVYGIHAGYLRNAKAGEDGMFIFDERGVSYENALNKATNFVCSVAELFERNGVTLLIENLFPSPKKQHSLFCTFNEIKEFMAKVPKSVGLLLDFGHLNIASNLLKFDRRAFLDDYIDEFGDRVHEIHISENRGIKDEHLAVKKNSWQLGLVKEFAGVPLRNGLDRIYCLEARNSEVNELHESLNLINENL